MGGGLGGESELGRGSKFTFVLPENTESKIQKYTT
jgi:signal transduction histidine kinase